MCGCHTFTKPKNVSFWSKFVKTSHNSFKFCRAIKMKHHAKIIGIQFLAEVEHSLSTLILILTTISISWLLNDYKKINSIITWVLDTETIWDLKDLLFTFKNFIQPPNSNIVLCPFQKEKKIRNFDFRFVFGFVSCRFIMISHLLIYWELFFSKLGSILGSIYYRKRET